MAQIPTDKYTTEIEIKKSRFIGYGFPIDSVEHAREKLKVLKVDYPDARHICYAFVWGNNNSHMGMSDDGEPGGTAGRPISEVVKGSGMENLLVAVVRYFGGTKLGTGGLVKAYTEISKLVVENIEREEYVERSLVKITLPYTLYKPVKLQLEEFECQIVREDFLTDIEVEFQIDCLKTKELQKKLSDISSGKLSVDTV